MKETIEKKKADYQADLGEAMRELEKFTILVHHLEGAILSCDELLKELNVSE